ncbi:MULTISPECIES: tRNA (adenosine(37)-N6)-dimethylallyltransferase MiaA [Calditerrivibrio]|uniref:tRNA (adenosine(37)-N6)-dimethylallyltransferase MiaA n=1 Tax=Calditerrivibrio TaxID=545865 RepID=UPI003C727D9B
MKIPIITGYTASGKTDISLKLAEKLDIEIISADAFQVYRFMDIGTGKPSKNELAKIKHHLIDCLNPEEVYSAGIFFEKTETIIEDILKRNKIPLVVGGTGLYVEVLTKGIFKSPKVDKELRQQILNDMEDKGIDYFYHQLILKDAEYAKKISKKDKNKITRAFEIMETTGMTVTEAHRNFHRYPKFDYEIFIIEKDRKELYKSIDERVLKMFQKGWVDEVNHLLNLGYSPENHSFKAIGYREIASFIKNGYPSIEKLIQDIQTKTRQFAKRQYTWFRHMMGLKKLSSDFQTNVDEIFKTIKLFW